MNDAAARAAADAAYETSVRDSTSALIAPYTAMRTAAALIRRDAHVAAGRAFVLDVATLTNGRGDINPPAFTSTFSSVLGVATLTNGRGDINPPAFTSTLSRTVLKTTRGETRMNFVTNLETYMAVTCVSDAAYEAATGRAKMVRSLDINAAKTAFPGRGLVRAAWQAHREALESAAVAFAEAVHLAAAIREAAKSAAAATLIRSSHTHCLAGDVFGIGPYKEIKEGQIT